MSTVQPAKVSLSIIDTLLALETHHKRGVILVDPADLQTLADELKRQKQLLEWAARIIDSVMYGGIPRYAPSDWFAEYYKGGTP